MQNLITTGNTPTMSSREIAELCEKRHPDVKRDVENMLRELGINVSSFAHIYRDARNREQREFLLDRELTETLITGYSIALRHKVIRRLHELEQKASAPSIPQSLPEALRLAADLAEQNSHLQLVVSEQAPKVEALNRIAVAEGSLCITDAAKSLQIKRKDLLKVMQERKWIYRRTGSTHFVAYQDKIQSGVMEHKYATVERPDGTEKTTEQARITAKGLVRLADIIREVA